MPREVIPGVLLWTRSEIGLPTPSPATGGATQRRLRVHHTTGSTLKRDDDDHPAWIRSIWRYHVETQKWDDIGYSFLVGRDDDDRQAAHIYAGRGWGKIGAHTYGYNDDLGVAYLGDGGEAIDPGVQRAFVWLRGARIVGQRPAYGHRDTAQTACPGDVLYRWVQSGMPAPLRRRTRVYRARATIEEAMPLLKAAADARGAGVARMYTELRSALDDGPKS
jgi:hypothetical protein